MNLPECDYRVDLGDPREFFCQHTRVHVRDSIVHAGICSQCTMRNVECFDPRPAPDSLEQARTAPPPLPRKVWNLSKSLAAFVADGMRFVSRDEYRARLEICDSCPERDGNRCRQCGCRLSLKARGRAFECPLAKWPGQNESEPAPE